MESTHESVAEELVQLREEYRELQETSLRYEAELETEVEALATRNEQLLTLNKTLQDEIVHLKSTLTSKVLTLQRENLHLSGEIARLVNENDGLRSSVREHECQVDWSESKLREKDFEIAQLSEQVNSALEEYAFVSAEAEGLKATLTEQTRRFQQRIKELTCQLDSAVHPQITVFVNQSQPKCKGTSMLKGSMMGQSSLGMVETLIQSLQTPI